MATEYNELLKEAERLTAEGRPADALLALLRAVRINRHGVEAQCALGEVWERLGHRDQAIEAWREALRWHSHPRMQSALARLLWQRGDTKGAQALVSAALAQAPEHVETLLLWAEVLRMSGREAEARASLRQAAQAAEVPLAAWPGLDEALRKGGDTAAAETLFVRLEGHLALSTRKILAKLSSPDCARDPEVLASWANQAQGWTEWSAAELNEGLRRLEARAEARALRQWLARRYREILAQRLRRQGGFGWPKRCGGESLRVGLLCSRWNEGTARSAKALQEYLPVDRSSLRVYALEESEAGGSIAAPPLFARLGHLSAAIAARWLAEEDCDLLLVEGEADSAHWLEILAYHPAPTLQGFGVIAAAAAALVDGEFRIDSPIETVLPALCAPSPEARPQGQSTADELRARWQAAVQLHQGGESVEADRNYCAIVADQGAVARVLYMRGALRRDRGSIRAALADFSAALDAAPGYVDAALALMQTLSDGGAHSEVAAVAAPVLREVDDEPRLWRALGSAARAARNLDEALHALQRAVALAPGDASAWFNLGLSAQAKGDETLALDALQKAALIDPQAPEGFYNLGALHQQRNEPERAALCYEQAIRLKPDEARAYKNLGEVLFAAGNYPAWLANFKRFEQRCPNSFALAGYALEACQFAGDWQRLDHYLNGLQKQHYQPRDATELVDGLEELLYLLLFFDFEPAAMGRFYRTYAEAATRLYGNPRKLPKERDPGRWRIGYLTGDVRDQVMGKMVCQWIEHHDREKFEIFLIATRPVEGAWGQRIAAAAEHFEDLSRMGDDAAIERLLAVKLDLLIDCSTHTRGARPAILAAKPARVQLTSIASAGCLGLPTIDFKLTDQIADLPEMQEHQVERFLAMAGCVYPYRHIEPLAEHAYQRERLGIPAEAFVLGAFVTLLKLSRRCLKLWREILDRLPRAVIALSPTNPGQRDAYVRVFAASGIEASRLVFVPQGRDECENQARYHLIDLVLDPMPFGGANGTIEALGMDVPVVTLCGRRHGERVGTSILTNLGVTSTIAQTGPEYVELSCRLGEDRGFLAAVREEIRRGRAGSAFTDIAKHVRDLESAYEVAMHRGAGSLASSSDETTGNDRAVAD